VREKMKKAIFDTATDKFLYMKGSTSEDCDLFWSFWDKKLANCIITTREYTLEKLASGDLFLKDVSREVRSRWDTVILVNVDEETKEPLFDQVIESSSEKHVTIDIESVLAGELAKEIDKEILKKLLKEGDEHT
jgi:hypothetical protein